MKRSKKQNDGRKRKRRFCGNQHTSSKSNVENLNPTIDCDVPSTSTVPSENIIVSPPDTANAGEADIDTLKTAADDDYFILVNFSILKDVISHMVCPDCYGDTVLTDNFSLCMGFVHSLHISCVACEWSHLFSTSNLVRKSVEVTPGRGHNKYEANVRAVIAFREIGRGYHGMQKFSECMNMSCLSNTPYYNLNNNSVYSAYKEAAEESMQNVASDLKTDDESPAKTTVKLDGAWSKRGHASLNGVVTATIGNKCIDVQAFSKHCKGCQMWENHKGTPAYNRWQAEHVCHINHTKSSGAMEGAGAVQIFNRSIEKFNLMYTEYLGDGDTSSFKEVVREDPYQQFAVTPVKLECVGHVQKRLGTRLRNLVKKHKGTANPLGGRGKLTENIINSMQNFYGMAIRNNTDNLYAMKEAVGAILWHCTDFKDENFRHRFCPEHKNTWCKWQLDKINGTSLYKGKISVPMSIHNSMKKIFEELSSDDLLKKCLHGEMQNSNEALNSLIWTRCPKNVFVSRSTFEIGINSAVLHFNDGENGIKSVFNYFGLSGKLFLEKSEKKDNARNKQMKRKLTDRVKKRRKRLRTIKKGFLDNEKELEKEDSYIPGGF